MSLLNDVLKDLSHEAAKERSADVEDVRDIPALKAANDLSYRITRGVVIKDSLLLRAIKVIAVFFCIFFVATYVKNNFLQGVSFGENKSSQKDYELTTVKNSAEKLAGQNISSPVVGSSEESANLHKQNRESSRLANQEKIGLLLIKAQQAFANNRLTSPVEDNAYSWFREILAIDPQNQEAKKGLEKLAETYFIYAQDAEQAGKIEVSKKYLERARFIQADHVEHLIEKTRNAYSLNETDLVKHEQSIMPLAAQHETIKPFAVASDLDTVNVPVETEQVKVNHSFEEQDKKHAETAASLAKQGKTTEAIQLLRQFVVEHTDSVVAAKQLVELSIMSGVLEDAAQILPSMVKLSPIERAQFMARILSAKGQDSAAVEQLKPFLNNQSSNEFFLNLLAGLEHRAGQYSESLLHYQSLIRQFGGKTVYWLGMALAYDGLGKKSEALQSYRQLATRDDMELPVKNYINQRINALSSE